MKKFSDFNIAPEKESFTGDKIKIERLLNIPITIQDFRVKDSKFNGNCLWLQIKKGGIEHVVFSGSATLIEMIQKVDKGDFPFETTIIKKDERFLFT